MWIWCGITCPFFAGQPEIHPEPWTRPRVDRTRFVVRTVSSEERGSFSGDRLEIAPRGQRTRASNTACAARRRQGRIPGGLAAAAAWDPCPQLCAAAIALRARQEMPVGCNASVTWRPRFPGDPNDQNRRSTQRRNRASRRIFPLSDGRCCGPQLRIERVHASHVTCWDVTLLSHRRLPRA
jgi:hypothetical protein